MRIFLLGEVTCLFFMVSSLMAQPTIQWQKTLGGSGTDRAYSIQSTPDEGFIIGGYSASSDGDVTENHGNYDFWIVKVDENGNIQWQKSYGGSGSDQVSSIQLTTDGGYIVAGSSESNDGDVFGNHGFSDFWIIKLDNAGNLEWSKSLGGSANDYAGAIYAMLNGEYIVVGASESNDGDVTENYGDRDFWIVKLNSNGDIMWQKSMGGSGRDYAQSVQPTPNGSFIVTGYSASNDGNVSENHGGTDFWVVKLDSIGYFEWEKSFGGSNLDIGSCIRVTPDNGFIITGISTSTDGDITDAIQGWNYWTVKLDSVGNIEWQKLMGGNDHDASFSVQPTNNKEYIVVGYSQSDDGDVTENHGSADYWVVNLDSTGTIRWQQSLGGSNFEYASDSQVLSDGAIVIAGYTSSNDGDVTDNQGDEDYWLVKLSDITSLKELGSNQPHLYIFPNPFIDRLIVRTTKNKQFFRIINAEGLEVERGWIHEEKEISLEGLPPGIYYLKAGETSKKIIKH